MRFVELLEGYYESLDRDLTDLLAAARARGLETVPIEQVVGQLAAMGHSVDSQSIMGLLNGNPFVQTATPDAIQLKASDEAAVSGDADAEEANADRVSQMAQDAAGTDDF